MEKFDQELMINSNGTLLFHRRYFPETKAEESHTRPANSSTVTVKSRQNGAIQNRTESTLEQAYKNIAENIEGRPGYTQPDHLVVNGEQVSLDTYKRTLFEAAKKDGVDLSRVKGFEKFASPVDKTLVLDASSYSDGPSKPEVVLDESNYGDGPSKPEVVLDASTYDDGPSKPMEERLTDLAKQEKKGEAAVDKFLNSMEPGERAKYQQIHELMHKNPMLKEAVDQALASGGVIDKNEASMIEGMANVGSKQATREGVRDGR